MGRSANFASMLVAGPDGFFLLQSFELISSSLLRAASPRAEPCSSVQAHVGGPARILSSGCVPSLRAAFRPSPHLPSTAAMRLLRGKISTFSPACPPACQLVRSLSVLAAALRKSLSRSEVLSASALSLRRAGCLSEVLPNGLSASFPPPHSLLSV
mmetsp:Transcript_11281/g.19903  ORF Transcript_11281/g.19903 Transcript_11281/m.19903 type:complete len:156 (-) Transcript_11281:12-479(-)